MAHSMATRRKMSLKAKGKNNAFYGRRHSSTTIKKLKQIQKGKNNPMFGHHHSKASKEKMRLAVLRRSRSR